MLPAHCHHRVRVAEQADLTAVRGVAADLSGALDEEVAGRVQLVVSELATNLLRHAKAGGAILLRRLERPAGVECIALDQGPGIADLGAALADRTDPEPRAGLGLGYGLGAVRRLSERFDIHSEAGVGTAVLSHVLARGPGEKGPPFAWGAVMLAMSGGEHCGDGWLVRPDGFVVALDGLGHGEAASIAARRAEAVAGAAAHGDDPQTVLAAMHEALKGTRGAVAAVLRLTEGRIDHSSVGNIAMTIIRRSGAMATTTSALSGRWGVVGYNGAPPPTASESWGPGDHLVLHSDGCARLAELFLERRLRHVDPALAAAVLLRDGGARVDDQTVIVLRNARRTPA
ncbi:ATP-binding protein [Azospirillum soli]|uniref:ATP-binding protein n=1 Tax=Azospirillum soli TaxID=1304799 RepID=UPI001AE5AE8B|nr:ATP-binding protein [Azospirillum soli]MBP2314278.1 anti-sigma regulatory factor (Ser/Thr protein kinase) [Azospirillum soli]